MKKTMEPKLSGDTSGAPPGSASKTASRLGGLFSAFKDATGEGRTNIIHFGLVATYVDAGSEKKARPELSSSGVENIIFPRHKPDRSQARGPERSGRRSVRKTTTRRDTEARELVKQKEATPRKY